MPTTNCSTNERYISKDYQLFSTLFQTFFSNFVFNRVTSDMSIVLRETILAISDSIETGTPVESEIVRVVSLSTTEISEKARFKKTIFRVP